jgi:hypothetical protein
VVELWSYIDKAGHEHPNTYRPRIAIKHIDSKRALIGFTGRKGTDESDRIPEASESGEPEEGYVFRDHFLDLRTLAFALTDRAYTLEAACDAFGVEHGKQRVQRHGVVTPKYIDYNRRDVLATAELAAKLLEEYAKHPVTLQPTKAYSPASIGKAYLRAMGIRPILERQSKFRRRFLGHAQSAFFGGRTSAHIRKVPVPIVYTDFLSMYPTVNSLMGLWRYVTARAIKIVEHCTSEVQAFLDKVTAADLFKPETWQYLPAFAQVVPNGDIMPSRSRYSEESHDWQVGVNYLYAKKDGPQQALWFSLPDLVASKLLTGCTPQLENAFRIEPKGKLPRLRPIKLRGSVEVDPGTQDFFKVVIEERKRLDRRHLPKTERDRLDRALKVLANAASYGIYAEMNRREAERKVDVTCYGIDAEPYHCQVAHPEVRGEYYFSPLASLITGAARLMLSLLELSVRALGGTYAMEDTDSMAIVATENGGTVPLGIHGNGSIHALSWEEVKGISHQFAALSPYEREAIPGSVLKIEDDNFDPKTKKQRQLWCVAISAKRYALFLRDEHGIPTLLRSGVNNKDDRWSEHGLGQVLNPTDPESEDRDWIAHVWLNIIRRACALPTGDLGFEHAPAIGRMPISSPATIQPLSNFNKEKPYTDQIKPFNFLLTAHVAPFGYPPDTNPERFHLIAPYQTDPREWLKMRWIDQYTGNLYTIVTAGHHGTRRAVRVKTHGNVLEDYEYHPEAKCADSEGRPCSKKTVGLLQRRHLAIEFIVPIGKESNNLEGVEAGVIHSEQDVYTNYPNPRHDEWTMKILPALNRIPLATLVKECRGKLSRRALVDLRAGRSRPHPKNQELLMVILQNLA